MAAQPLQSPPNTRRGSSTPCEGGWCDSLVPRLPGDSAAAPGLGFGGCRSVLGFLCGTDFPLRFAEPSGPWWDLSFMSGQDPSQAFTQSRQAWLGAGSRHLSLPTHSESSALICSNHRGFQHKSRGHLERRMGLGGGEEGHAPVRPGGGVRGCELPAWGPGNPFLLDLLG